MRKILLSEGDITAADADAIVLPSCVGHRPPAAGDAEVCPAGDLPARVVIHAAAAAGVAALATAMRASFALARERGLSSIALPALGVGPGLSLQAAAEVMLGEARRHLAEPTSLEHVRFVLDGEPAYRVFELVNDAERVREGLARLRR
jgi:O-acetyl-ADP-ribose deacetylase (regulator of RNase III)